MRNAWTVARYTFLQLYKGKAMISAIIMSSAVIVLSFIATEISYGVAARVSLDFGIGASALCSMGLAIFLGLGLISKEIEQRTLFMILTRPINRGIYLLGKYLGVALMIGFSILLLMISSLVAFKFYSGVLDWTIFAAFIFIFLESIIILLMVVNLTLVANINISLVFGIILPILGHTLSSTFQHSMVQKYPSMKIYLKAFTFLLPDLDKINMRPYLLYKDALSNWPIYSNLIYALLFIMALALSSIFIFNKKEIH